MLDSGKDLPFPDGILINGRGQYGNTFTVEQGVSRFLVEVNTGEMVFLTHDFLMFRQNVSVSGLECGVGDVVEREDSRPCDAAGGGGRFTHPAEHLLLLRSPFGPVLLVPRHGRSTTHGLLHRGFVPVHEHRAVNHRRPPLQQLWRAARRSAAWRADDSDRLVPQPGAIYSVSSSSLC